MLPESEILYDSNSDRKSVKWIFFSIALLVAMFIFSLAILSRTGQLSIIKQPRKYGSKNDRDNSHVLSASAELLLKRIDNHAADSSENANGSNMQESENKDLNPNTNDHSDATTTNISSEGPGTRNELPRFFFVEKDELDHFRISSFAPDGSDYKWEYEFDHSVESITDFTFVLVQKLNVFFSFRKDNYTYNFDSSHPTKAPLKFSSKSVKAKVARNYSVLIWSDLEKIIVCGDYSTYFLRDFEGEKGFDAVISYENDEMEVKGLELSVDGAYLYALFSDVKTKTQHLSKIDLKTSKGVVNTLKFDESITAMSISPDGQRMAFISDSPFFRILELDLTKNFGSSFDLLPYKIKNANVGLKYLYWAADGKHLFNYGKNGELFVFTLEDREIIPTRLKDSKDKFIKVEI